MAKSAGGNPATGALPASKPLPERSQSASLGARREITCINRFGYPKRYILVGETFAHRLVVVSHTERGSGIRIISARLATRRELREYEEQ
jgi:hypothetical protein